MNSFEQFTLIIGLLAVGIEAFQYLKRKVLDWFGLHHKK